MVCREINSNSTPMSPFSQNEQYQPISYNLPYPWRLVLKVQSLRPVVGLEELGHARKILLRDRRETKLQRERRKHTIARQSFILWLWECLETFVLQFLSVLALLFNALVMTGHSLRAMTSLADIRGSASFFLKISKKVSPYIHLPDPPPPPPPSPISVWERNSPRSSLRFETVEELCIPWVPEIFSRATEEKPLAPRVSFV